jgi:hypothetical protein
MIRAKHTVEGTALRRRLGLSLLAIVLLAAIAALCVFRSTTWTSSRKSASSPGWWSSCRWRSGLCRASVAGPQPLLLALAALGVA